MRWRFAFVSAVVLLCWNGIVWSSDRDCPSNAVLDRLLDFGDLIFGEVHGTVESPQFMQCVVERAVQREIEPSSFPWSFRKRRASQTRSSGPVKDGRASVAMWSLLEFLVRKEEEGALRVHFQHSKLTPDVVDIDEHVGLELKQLVKEGRVIALAGNYHSSREAVAWHPSVKPAGMYVGSAITHIRIEAARDGEAWFCSSTSCGVGPLRRPRLKGGADPVAGDLVDGAELNHDFIFFVDRFTASPPVRTE